VVFCYSWWKTSIQCEASLKLPLHRHGVYSNSKLGFFAQKNKAQQV